MRNINKDLFFKKMYYINNKIDKNRIFRKDSSYFKTENNVFDTPTLKALSLLVDHKFISEIGGPISTGKEANVFYGIKDGSEIAIKIYRINSMTFRSINSYLVQDYRFENIKKKRKDIVFSFAQKEYQNLIRLKKYNINVPNPIKRYKNILLMDFIGENEISYPKLKNLKINDKIILNKIFCSIINQIKLMYQKSNLIHSDLSEYNILINNITYEPIIIDVSQSILKSNKNADYYLKRDIKNISNFFRKYTIFHSEKDIYN